MIMFTCADTKLRIIKYNINPVHIFFFLSDLLAELKADHYFSEQNVNYLQHASARSIQKGTNKIPFAVMVTVDINSFF